MFITYRNPTNQPELGAGLWMIGEKPRINAIIVLDKKEEENKD